ncbi:hypothetical protein V6N13_013170 [Hibiscus sabdariffa]
MAKRGDRNVSKHSGQLEKLMRSEQRPRWRRDQSSLLVVNLGDPNLGVVTRCVDVHVKSLLIQKMMKEGKKGCALPDEDVIVVIQNEKSQGGLDLSRYEGAISVENLAEPRAMIIPEVENV